jgi:hypothetical protein
MDFSIFNYFVNFRVSIIHKDHLENINLFNVFFFDGFIDSRNFFTKSYFSSSPCILCSKLPLNELKLFFFLVCISNSDRQLAAISAFDSLLLSISSKTSLIKLAIEVSIVINASSLGERIIQEEKVRRI